MAYTVKKYVVWTKEFEDRAGGLASVLEPLAQAGVDLAFAVGQRRLDKPGVGMAFLGGISGAKGTKAAVANGISQSAAVTALRVEETNKPGSCHKMLNMLANAGISLLGLTATVFGKKCVYILAFDSAADADNAARVLKRGGK